MTKFIFVYGGVISGVGKGVTTASLGKMLKSYGFKTTLIKIDPYLNFDAGTLRPTEHGEVWVTEDGGEIDQDLGTYERFMDEDILKCNSITSGQIYKTVIDNERAGAYLGKTVQFIPHIPEEIMRRIKAASEGYEIAIIEVGGIVGDYENAPFLFAAKSFEQEFGTQSVAHVLVTYLPVPYHISEMKTKPTQQAVRLLRQEGLVPDFIVCRTAQAMDEDRKEKIEAYAHISAEHIISAPDVTSIYEVPLNFERDAFGKKMLAHLHLEPRRQPDWQVWEQQVTTLLHAAEKVRIGIVGKYIESGSFELHDSYVSIEHALLHAAASQGRKCEIVWLHAQQCESIADYADTFNDLDGILIPGGFGAGGVEGKIEAIAYARKEKIPFLGICYGMQLAVVEYARNVMGLKDAHTTEVNPHTGHPVVDLLPMQRELIEQQDLGGTMRVGSYPAYVLAGSRVYDLYARSGRMEHAAGAPNGVVFERHRHRYEIQPAYVQRLQDAGLSITGFYEREDGTRLTEYIELADHPFFVGCQAHPEFKSRLGNPNPLFVGFIEAAIALRTRREQERSLTQGHKQYNRFEPQCC